MRPTTLLIPLALGACVSLDGPALGEDTAEVGSQPDSRNLDPPPPAPGGTHELDMLPGRLDKVPVSWFYQGTISAGVAHHLKLRTVGCTGTADTAIVVTWTEGAGLFAQPYTAFANDGQPGDNGRCTLLDVGGQPGGMTYNVYVVSMNRATSHATLQFSTNGGATWQNKATEHFGGTLVRVGPLQTNDFVEVVTATDGAATIDPPGPLPPVEGYEGTRALLFTAPPAGTAVHGRPALFSDSGLDGDPRIQVGAGWTSRDTLLLLGKDVRSSTSKRGVEVAVDLVRGPTDQAVSPPPTISCNGPVCTSATTVLPPGRYSVAVGARGIPLGHGTDHPASDVGTWQNPAFPLSCSDTGRGQGNSLAFVASLMRKGRAAATRIVPRGQLGGHPAFGPFSEIHFEVESDGVSSFVIELDTKAPDVEIAPNLRIERNPQANEIKVASWNFAYWAHGDSSDLRAASLQNGVDVLATRGDIDATKLTITEEQNRAPWQWDADVVVFQEFWQDTLGAVERRLDERSPYAWSRINAMTERSSYSPGETAFFGPIFARTGVQPPEGLKYSDTQLAGGSGAACVSSTNGSDRSCALGSVDETAWVFTNFAVPAKIVARRDVGSGATAQDLPVAVFNWHLYSPTMAYAQRELNVARMIEHIEYLMAQPSDGAFPAGACAFNRDCVNATHASDNRIILIGDSNMANSKCGEFTSALRRLREHFGYAIDVSAAAVDDTGRTFDMHYSGASLLDPNTGTYGDCGDSTWARTPFANGSADGCPFHFEHVSNWNDDPDFSLASWFPWWAASFGDVNGGSLSERYDVVFLVGRGWAKDDPVRAYKVLPTRDEPSPMSANAGGGVETRYDENCDGSVTDVPSQPDTLQSYAPLRSVGACGLDAGAAALRSDHAPLGVRLRITE